MRPPAKPPTDKPSSSTSTGWGHTRGWSAKVHFFKNGRAACSGSTQREGEKLASVADTVEGPVCPDCASNARAATNSKRQRGIARMGGRAVDRRRPHNFNSRARLYATA